MASTHAYPAHQFGDVVQQKDSVTLGMWIFLVTEIMFFGVLFTGYAYYRTRYPEAFAEGSRHLEVAIGGTNTAVLLLSSFTMALAVRAAKLGFRRALSVYLVCTLMLGLVFLSLKGVEYHEKYVQHHVPGASFDFPGPDRGPVRLYFTCYFIMTGTHAVHMIAGVGVLGALAVLARRGRYSAPYHTPVEMAGLYWHFVDIIWIFLYPMLYLLGRH